MNPHRLNPRAAAVGSTKMKQVEQAKEMQKIVEERAARSGIEAPPYEFIELIGRGSFGRVFKSKHRATNQLVAVKITEIDKSDYEVAPGHRDDLIADLTKEITILQRLKESRAQEFVNVFYEAHTVHSELWIVSEYCSGGSLHTLMKAWHPGGLDEKYIIPVARDLASALRFVHEAGILHRDVKSGNILISEDGRLQLCDFGISNVVDSEVSKRSTIIGTPNWMSPELQRQIAAREPDLKIQYGFEVDIWAYGCTLYEMATGNPPNHRVHGRDLATKGKIPWIEGDQHSPALCDLSVFILQARPQDRPSAEKILQHPYLLDTAPIYPTSALKDLIGKYEQWLHGGGQRASLFNPYQGAQGPTPLQPRRDTEDNDWRFSIAGDLESQFAEYSAEQSGAAQPAQSIPAPRKNRFLANLKEQQAKRGGAALGQLFDPNGGQYKYNEAGIDDNESVMSMDSVESSNSRPASDLALRNYANAEGAKNRETVIDLDMAMPMSFEFLNLELGDVPTIRAQRKSQFGRDEEEAPFDSSNELTKRATKDWNNDITKRATKDWKFPYAANDRPNRKTQEWTFASAMAERPMERTERPNNRKTQEWSFASAMEEAGQTESTENTSRRRPTRDFQFPLLTAPLEDPRSRGEFVFPGPDSNELQSSLSDEGPTTLPPYLSPEGSEFTRPPLRHAATDRFGMFEGGIQSAPESPNRDSRIDLDFAIPEPNFDFSRPMTADSATESGYTTGTETVNGDPFDLENQVQLSQKRNRASYHIKSQSEPVHNLPGLLTPQAQNYSHQRVPSHGPLHMRDLSRSTTKSSISGSQGGWGLENDPFLMAEELAILMGTRNLDDTDDEGAQTDVSSDDDDAYQFKLANMEELDQEVRRVEAYMNRSSGEAYSLDALYYQWTEPPRTRSRSRSNYIGEDGKNITSAGSLSSSFSSSDILAQQLATGLATPSATTSFSSVQTNEPFISSSSRAPSTVPSSLHTSISFPMPSHTNPDALKYDADPEVVEEELVKRSREFAYALKVARMLLKRTDKPQKRSATNGSGYSTSIARTPALTAERGFDAEDIREAL